MNDKTTTAIAEYSPTAAALADLSKRMANVLYDVSTPKGMAAARADRAEVRELRVALEKKRVEIKAPALKRCNEIDTEAKRITAELLKFETPPDIAIKAAEEKIEAERAARVAAEQKRVAGIHSRIAEFRGCVEMVLRHPSMLAAQIAEHMLDLQKIVVDDSFGEFEGNADIEKADAFKRLNELHTAAVAREYEAERLRNERAAFEAEQADVRAKELARQATVDAENRRIAAEQAAAQKVIDDGRRELEARQQAERDAQVERARAAEALRLAEEQEAERQRIANYEPSFDEIVAFVAAHFGKSPDVVRTWIREAKAQSKAA